MSHFLFILLVWQSSKCNGILYFKMMAFCTSKWWHFILQNDCILYFKMMAFCISKWWHFVLQNDAFCTSKWWHFVLQNDGILYCKMMAFCTSKWLHFVLQNDCILYFKMMAFCTSKCPVSTLSPAYSLFWANLSDNIHTHFTIGNIVLQNLTRVYSFEHYHNVVNRLPRGLSNWNENCCYYNVFTLWISNFSSFCSSTICSFSKTFSWMKMNSWMRLKC